MPPLDAAAGAEVAAGVCANAGVSTSRLAEAKKGLRRCIVRLLGDEKRGSLRQCSSHGVVHWGPVRKSAHGGQIDGSRMNDAPRRM
jgi:hypothetical protein